jgi:hypothetical protein
LKFAGYTRKAFFILQFIFHSVHLSQKAKSQTENEGDLYKTLIEANNKEEKIKIKWNTITRKKSLRILTKKKKSQQNDEERQVSKGRGKK